MSRWRRTLGLACLWIAIAAAALAQFGSERFRGRFRQQILPNAPYDGRFTFVRVNYESTPDGYWYGGQPAWAHGYPVAEENLMKIMNEVSYLGAHDEAFNSIRFDDPELYKYPIAYVIEPDWWAITDSEVKALREYMQKGGFVIVDDFKVLNRGFRRFGGGGEGNAGGGGWPTFEAMMKQVMPEGRFVELSPSDPVFHSFFDIRAQELSDFPQAYIPGKPVFLGLYEDNDPMKRLLMVVNFNTDISQYWEWSGRGLRPFDDTNEAYKLGVNYLIYGLTH
jgi:Domain of unknown function (DUF4159)